MIFCFSARSVDKEPGFIEEFPLMQAQSRHLICVRVVSIRRQCLSLDISGTKLFLRQFKEFKELVAEMFYML